MVPPRYAIVGLSRNDSQDVVPLDLLDLASTVTYSPSLYQEKYRKRSTGIPIPAMEVSMLALGEVLVLGRFFVT